MEAGDLGHQATTTVSAFGINGCGGISVSGAVGEMW